MAEPEWLPIESNPPLMTDYASKLGFDVSAAAFHDVLALDEWATDLVPRPVHAVLMLFPIKAASEAHKDAEEVAMVKAGAAIPAELYFTKQKVGNACGTIGVVHAALNISTLTGGPLPLRPDSWLTRFYARTAALTPDARAEALGEDQELASAHSDQVEVGDSDVCDDTFNHFVAFIEKAGSLWELDGRKSRPVNHGPVEGGDLLLAAVRVAKEFMARDPEELRFTLVALAPPAEEEEDMA
jgi:ubiquitin carboxyl-terminal hydrolase L3